MTETPEKKKAGRPKKETKVTEANVEVAVQESPAPDPNAEALKQAMAMIAELKGEIDTLKAEKASAPTQVGHNDIGRKVKCIGLAHHPVNVFTQPNCKGRVFSFKEYGQIIQMKYDELLSVLAYYPKTMASGLIYICDKDVIVDNGLEDAYQHIYDKDTMDEIVLLRRECDAEFILGMSVDLRESTLIQVVRNYKNGEKMDATAMALLREAGYDIVKMADETKI